MSKKVNLKDALKNAELFIDGDWIESKDQDQNGDIRLIQLADIGNGKYLNKSSRFMTLEKAEKLKCTFIKKGDILLARMPEPLGRSCLFLGDEKSCVTVVDICIIRPDKTINSSYLNHQINSSFVRNQINNYITGTTRKRISRSNLGKVEILLPSLEKQKQIAKTLDKANELIELRKESITKLDALAKSIFIDMFGDPVSNPKGWELVTFDKLIEIKPKSIKPENIQELDKYVGLENIEKDLGNLINIKNAINEDLKSNKFHFDENTILYGKLRPYLNKVALPSFSGVCSTDILPIKVINANKIFVVFIIRHNSFVDIMTSRATGANLPRVNKSDLLTQKVFNPPIELQNKFAKIIEKIEEQKSLYEKELELLQNNFDALLQKSFQE